LRRTHKIVVECHFANESLLSLRLNHNHARLSLRRGNHNAAAASGFVEVRDLGGPAVPEGGRVAKRQEAAPCASAH
jgi:hypothetical protein